MRVLRIIPLKQWSIRLVALLLLGSPVHAVLAEQAQFLSPVYTVDKIYRSMQGPMTTQPVHLPVSGNSPELLWVTGYDAVMVGVDGKEPASQEFMCHSNLDMGGERLFTLSQGQQSIRFPRGFGIPVMSGEDLSLTTQVLNHNLAHPDLRVRHKVTIYYRRDADLLAPMTALVQRGVFAMASLDSSPAYFGVNRLDLNPQRHGPGCLVASQASDASFKDQFGRRFTGHWLVPPGRETNRSLVTRLLDLTRDTTIHYIAVHLHPYAESLELRDRISGATVFHSRVRPLDGRIGIASVDHYGSRKGLPLHFDHEYELVSIYNNTGKDAIDSMAVMYLYLRDTGFDKDRFVRESVKRMARAQRK